MNRSRDDATGPPDRQTLFLLERHLASDSLVAETTFDPDAYEPWLLRGHLDAEQYPSSVTAGQLDIRWFTTGDFSFHYAEHHEGGEHWECRWDRHPNAHDTRLHFHEPPSATEVVDLDFPVRHPLDVYSTVLTAIATRVKTLWSSDG